MKKITKLEQKRLDKLDRIELNIKNKFQYLLDIQYFPIKLTLEEKYDEHNFDLNETELSIFNKKKEIEFDPYFSKVCGCCKEEKPLTEFYRSIEFKYNKHNYCKKCFLIKLKNRKASK